MCWGVDMLDEPERIGYAVTQSGVDLISGLLDNELGEDCLLYTSPSPRD